MRPSRDAANYDPDWYPLRLGLIKNNDVFGDVVIRHPASARASARLDIAISGSLLEEAGKRWRHRRAGVGEAELKGKARRLKLFRLEWRGLHGHECRGEHRFTNPAGSGSRSLLLRRFWFVWWRWPSQTVQTTGASIGSTTNGGATLRDPHAADKSRMNIWPTFCSVMKIPASCWEATSTGRS